MRDDDIMPKVELSDKWMKAQFRGEKIQINDDGTLNYNFFVAGFPFCIDGYKDEIKEEIEKRGYKTGIGYFVYRDNISHKELIECMIFKSAYDYTYYSVVSDDLLSKFKDVDISITNFMKEVDENIKKIKQQKMFRLNWDDVFNHNENCV